MRKIVYIGFAFQHHKNTCSGYHRIKEYLNYDKVIDCQKEYELHSNPKNFLQKILRRVLDLTLGTETTFCLLYCIIYNIFHSNCTFHFIYGENTYKNIRPFIRKSNKLVCTLHQPISYFEKNKSWSKRLKSLDGIIVMSDDQILEFQKLAPQAKVEFIPHGIDTEYFKPSNKPRKNQILMVGNWLRDFHFANEVFQELFKKDLEVNVVVVTFPTNFAMFESHERLILLNNISNERLCDLYKESKCLFLPLKAYTANNAVLEAAATNCPIVIATPQSATSYLDEQYISILPQNQDDVVHCISHPISTTTREYVLKNYSWVKIADVTKSFLKNFGNI